VRPEDKFADLFTSAIDTARAMGDEKTATILEALAPAAGAWMRQQREKSHENRAFFIADLASRLVSGAFEVGLDSNERMEPLARRAVKLAALLLAESEQAEKS
jgi:hypothetical protein